MKKTHIFLAGIIFLLSPWDQSWGDETATASNPSPKLDIVWVRDGLVQALKHWTLADLTKLKSTTSSEKDPVTEKVMKWQGVSLADLVDKALEGLTAENRAQIDLVILKNAAGDFAPIPRFVMKRYPLMLAILPPGSPFVDRGPLYSVIPWTSRPNILKEILPLDRYFISQVSRIELANDEELNRALFLKRRTDPSAIRGEKLFIQSCSLCHQLDRVTPKGEALAIKKVMDPEKSPLSGTSLHNKKLILQEKDRKSILRYLNAYEAENLADIKKSTLQSQNLPSP